MLDHTPLGPSFRFPDGNPFKGRGDRRSVVTLLAAIAAVVGWGCLHGRQVDAAGAVGVLLVTGWERRRDLRCVVGTAAFVTVILVCGSMFRR